MLRPSLIKLVIVILYKIIKKIPHHTFCQNLDDLNYPQHRKEYMIYLSKSVVNTIGDMYYGAAELQHFLDAYPDVDISY